MFEVYLEFWLNLSLILLYLVEEICWLHERLGLLGDFFDRQLRRSMGMATRLLQF